MATNKQHSAVPQERKDKISDICQSQVTSLLYSADEYLHFKNPNVDAVEVVA